ncbi:MAG: STAS domain-containing protein [Tepidisphaeraceae bacterium]|jgi:anti-sigma B factor antagonist
MADELFTIQQEKSARVVELRFRPEMDALLMDGLLDAVAVELDRAAGAGWVLDLSNVTYLNSAGLGMLVNIRQKVKQSRGKLAICGLSPRMMDLFKSCCLERLFLIVKTRSQALAEVL